MIPNLFPLYTTKTLVACTTHHVLLCPSLRPCTCNILRKAELEQQRKQHHRYSESEPKASNRPLVLRAGPTNTLCKPTTIHEWRSRPYRTSALHPITLLDISRSPSAPHPLATCQIILLSPPISVLWLYPITADTCWTHTYITDPRLGYTWRDIIGWSLRLWVGCLSSSAFLFCNCSCSSHSQDY